MERSIVALIVMDHETIESADTEQYLRPFTACWTRHGSLEPVAFGVGRQILGALRAFFSSGAALLPEETGSRVRRLLDSYYQPTAAYVYAITPTCARAALNLSNRTETNSAVAPARGSEIRGSG